MNKKSTGTFGDGVAAGIFGTLFTALGIVLLVIAYNAVVDDIAARSGAKAHSAMHDALREERPSGVVYDNAWPNATTLTICKGSPIRQAVLDTAQVGDTIKIVPCVDFKNNMVTK